MAKLAQNKGEAEPARLRTWGMAAAWDDPVAPYLRQFRADLKNAPAVRPTGLTRKDYLKLITGEVELFKGRQNADGAIIDPYLKVEVQYSTPAFALAAAALVAHDGRADLLEPAARAMDWSVKTLSEHHAAGGHEDFFAPLIANALPLLKPRVGPARAAKWECNSAASTRAAPTTACPELERGGDVRRVDLPHAGPAGRRLSSSRTVWCARIRRFPPRGACTSKGPWPMTTSRACGRRTWRPTGTTENTPRI